MEREGMVTFTIGGIVFEYDEEKNQKNFRNMAYRSEVQLVYFLEVYLG